MGKFNSIEDLGEKVDEAESQVLICDGIDLRDACGESRLKSQARERIRDSLASRGLVALPGVPEDQEHPVFVTRLSSPVDLLYKAFVTPNDQSLGRVRGASGGTTQVTQQQDAARQLGELLEEARTEVAKLVGADEFDRSPVDS